MISSACWKPGNELHSGQPYRRRKRAAHAPSNSPSHHWRGGSAGGQVFPGRAWSLQGNEAWRRRTLPGRDRTPPIGRPFFADPLPQIPKVFAEPPRSNRFVACGCRRSLFLSAALLAAPRRFACASPIVPHNASGARLRRRAPAASTDPMRAAAREPSRRRGRPTGQATEATSATNSLAKSRTACCSRLPASIRKCARRRRMPAICRSFLRPAALAATRMSGRV